MTITILYDNTVYQPGLKSDWGFSCMVQAEHRTILFDAGSNGSLLLENMRKMGINPLSINDVFISHPHFDHIGGLSAFLNYNHDVNVYVPISLRGIRGVKQVVELDEPAEIMKHIYSTGELDDIEQSMAVNTEKGLVLIVGCSHPSVEKILQCISQFGKVYAIIGGLHGFNEYDLLREIEWICPTHCTRYIAEIKKMFPEKYLEGGAGRILTDKDLRLS